MCAGQLPDPGGRGCGGEAGGEQLDCGLQVTYLPVLPSGLVDMEVLEAAIRPDTSLVSIMTVNNEIGVIQVGSLWTEVSPTTTGIGLGRLLFILCVTENGKISVQVIDYIATLC